MACLTSLFHQQGIEAGETQGHFHPEQQACAGADWLDFAKRSANLWALDVVLVSL